MRAFGGGKELCANFATVELFLPRKGSGHDRARIAANDHPLLKKDQSDGAFIESYCDFGFGGRVGLLDFCDQLGRACIAWLLRAGPFGIVRPSASRTASVSTADRQSIFGWT